MKTLLSWCASLLLLFSFAPSSASARDAVSINFFYNNLEPYGNWREVGDYGYCWQPNDVDRDWRPYSEGRWLYSDAGWTWDGDEPFAWAVYHYGRWANVERIGWIWIPGTEWGPGWVSWRHSDDYVGWAPLPPEARFRQSTGFRGWVDDYYNIGPSSYCFIANRDFGSRRLRSVFINPREYGVIINQTTNITNIYYEDNSIHNGGLRFDQQSRLSSEPLHRYKLERREDYDGDDRNHHESMRSHIKGEALSMFAIPFGNHAAEPPHRVAEKVERAEINHGWKEAGNADDVAALREKMRGKVKPPEDLPKQPKFEHGPVEAQRPFKDRGAKQDKPEKQDEPAPRSKSRNDDEPRQKPQSDAKKPQRDDVMPKDRPRNNDEPRQQPQPKDLEPKQPDAKPQSKHPNQSNELKHPKGELTPEPRRPNVEPEPRHPKVESEPKRRNIDPEPKRQPEERKAQPKQPMEERKAQPKHSEPEPKRPAAEAPSGKGKDKDSEKSTDKEKGKGKHKPE